MNTFSTNPLSGSVLSRPLSSALSSPLQKQVEGLVETFVDQATDLSTLAAMTGGAYAYRFGRWATLSAGSRYLSTLPSLVRFGSVGLGLTGESAAFAGLQRGFRTLKGQASPQSFEKEWFGAAISLGSLKFFGKLGEGQNLPLQHLLSDFGMVGAHQAAFLTGLEAKPSGDLSSQLLNAEATNWQMKAGLSLVHGLNPQLLSTERALDLSLKSRESSLTSIGSGRFHPLDLEKYATERAPAILMSKSLEGEKPRLLLMSIASKGEGGGPGLQRKDYPHIVEKSLENAKGVFHVKLFSREPIQDVEGMVAKLSFHLIDLIYEKPSPLKGPIAELIRQDPNIRNTLKDSRFKSFEFQFDVQGEEILGLRMYHGDVRWELVVAKAQVLPKRGEKTEADELSEKLKTPIDELPLSTLVKNSLDRVGIFYLGELIRYPEVFLRKKTRFLGKKTLKELEDLLSSMDLSFGMKMAWSPPSIAHFLNLPLDRLCSGKEPILSRYGLGVLRSLGIWYMGQLAQANEADLAKKIDSRELHDLKELLKVRGLTLGSSLDWRAPQTKP